MATKILAIPQSSTPLDFRTQTNVGWIDSFTLDIAVTAAGYPAAGNVGRGSITVTSVVAQTALGAHTVRIVEVMGNLVRFTVQDPEGNLTGIGEAGAPAAAGGITFTLTPGAEPLAVGDAFVLAVTGAPLDLTGIRLDLWLRTDPDEPSVEFAATTQAGPALPAPTIVNGGLSGQIAMAVPALRMSRLAPAKYIHDIVASADGVRVLVAYGTVEHVRGITYPAD